MSLRDRLVIYTINIEGDKKATLKKLVCFSYVGH